MGMAAAEMVVKQPQPKGPRLALVGMRDAVVDDVRTAAPPGWTEVACDPFPRGAASRVSSHSPDAVLLYADTDMQDAMVELAEFRRLLPSTRVMVLSQAKDPDRILRAMREGAAEYIVLPEDLGELARSLAELGAQRAAAASGARQVVAVVGARGGVGATTCAVHLAGEMNARAQGRVALLDVNPVAPDAGVFLDLDLPFSLLDVMRNVHRLDETLLHGVINRHPSGLAVVSLPEDELARAEVARLGVGAPLRALDVLRNSFDTVVMDCGSVPDPFTAPMISTAETVLLVVHPDVATLKNAIRRLEWLRSSGVRPESVFLVVNRHGGRSARLRDEDLSESLKCPIAATLPSDAAASVALDEGRLLATGRSMTPLRRELQRLAAPWLAAASPAAKTQKPRRFAFLRMFA